ncbi:MAG: GTP cyclohydrolase I FolE [Kiritimatiellaeota bacterium]|nr:GTP cyclohydrolase I FolE [Kiritimatiellota bacterium]
MNIEKVKKLIAELLVEIGEDPNREGLLKTPERVAKSFEFLTRGYAINPREVVGDAVFETVDSDNMVIVRDIEVYSLCEHHLLPFFGKCHVGYISRGKVLGVSKIARIVDGFAARLQLQERLSSEIARAVKEETGAEGVGVVMECRHLCMMMRGVEKQNSVMTTSSVLGSFHDDPATRSEFMTLALRVQ